MGCHPSILTHTSCYSPAMAASYRSRSSQPTYSPPRGHPLPLFPWLSVVPFPGLALVHTLVLSARCGQCGQRTTSIGRVLYVERLTAGSTAAARKCLLITRKIMIPPPDSRDPSDRPPYFMKKNVSPDCWDPPATSSHGRKCLTVGTHLVEAYVALSFWS